MLSFKVTGSNQLENSQKKKPDCNKLNLSTIKLLKNDTNAMKHEDSHRPLFSSTTLSKVQLHLSDKAKKCHIMLHSICISILSKLKTQHKMLSTFF